MQRRTILTSLLLGLSGCAPPFPATSEADAEGGPGILDQCIEAHGRASWSGLTDVNVSYDGHFSPIVGSLQPDLVDSGFRGTSQERWRPANLVLAQAHRGPAGRKQVVRVGSIRDGGMVRVWLNGSETNLPDKRAAAALVADGYALFLGGPLALLPRDADLGSARYTGTEQIMQRTGEFQCDVVRLTLAPGLGFSPHDEVAVFIDRSNRLMRKVRFTLDGLRSTQGAVAEVDTMGHVHEHGVWWPTQFHERLLRPLPLPVHDWQLTGLDVGRGWDLADVQGPDFAGRALAPAKPLASSVPAPD